MAKEGWGLMRPGDRVYHYYVDSVSLCGSIMFYFDEVDPDTGNVEPQKEDCKRCFKKLVERRKTKASGGGATE